MRSKRNSKIQTVENSIHQLTENSRRASPPKIYLNSSINNSILSESPFHRKGRSIPKDCLGLNDTYQIKISIPKRGTSRMVSKSGRSNYEADNSNSVFQQKQDDNMEMEYMIPMKQQIDNKLPYFNPMTSSRKEQPTKRVIKDASLVHSQNQPKLSTDLLKNSEKQKFNKFRKQNYHLQQEVDPKRQVQEFNSELKALRVKRTESFEWSEEFQQEEESSQQNQFRQFTLGTYYMDNLRKYLQGLNLEGLYAQLYINHFVQQFHSLQLSKLFKEPEDNEIQSRMIQLQKKKNQKTLVLDLDETLIHCNEQITMKYDFKIPIQMPNGQMYEAGISIRPYAQQFLQECSKFFEVIIFTASHPSYANKIIDKLDPMNKCVSCRLYRDHCIQTQQGVHIKDLRVVNRNLKDIVLIDNAAYSYAFQITNGIPIIPYIDNNKDNELIGVIDYLKILLQMDDVRELNSKTFLLNKIQQCQSLDEAMRLLLNL